jgi:hypothetical protein
MIRGFHGCDYEECHSLGSMVRFAMVIETEPSSESSVLIRATRRHIPEHAIL